MQRLNLDRLADEGSFACFDKPPHRRPVRGTHLGRNDQLRQIQAERLLFRPAKGQFRLPVPASDHPFGAHRDDRLLGIRDDACQALFFGAKARLKLQSLADLGGKPGRSLGSLLQLLCCVLETKLLPHFGGQHRRQQPKGMYVVFIEPVWRVGADLQNTHSLTALQERGADHRPDPRPLACDRVDPRVARRVITTKQLLALHAQAGEALS
ncbi:hypothetical protein FHT02_002283 [Sphingomonas xinjiangensis]|uniref:Uncharacterized protein n=1 Tax=Sphingomonas xinjiangensis TaxID=643568 RepID=A0A840YQZ5_9SPHN|nr:hypothetical protein [Sphingomonas xinjiangensis]MBB5711043.1 hypothetical protein [Sphingomonas xinjiangensis]